MMNKALKSISVAIFSLAAHLALAASTVDKQITQSHSYICHFGKYGVVTIDTRPPGASITIHGVRYPAKGGSYFYQTDDGKVAIAFNPQLTAWTYLSAEDPAGITDSHCRISINRG